MTIEGTVRFPDVPASLWAPGSVHPTATLRVCLLDVDRIDAPSIVVAETVTAIGEDALPSQMPFQLTVDDDLPRGRRYELAAHLDCNGDGRVSVGDFITKRAYPWPPADGRLSPLRLDRVS